MFRTLWARFHTLLTWLTRILLIAVIMKGASLDYLKYIPQDGKMTIAIDEEEQYQTVDGWGTSACWWSQMIADDATREDIARLLYSKEGLGLNIYRYNVGGGYDPATERVTNPWRLTESFYYLNPATGEYEYDFSRDANAQAMLREALSYGCIDTVVLFANSPHYSMTVTGASSGGTEEYQSNLKKECYGDFVDYFLTITEYFLDQGIPVKYISPLNEPQWSWGGGWVGQEGCHYEPEEAVELIRQFAAAIKERQLDVKLCVPESGEISDLTKTYFETLTKDETVRDCIGTLAYHSYWSDDNLFNKIRFGYWLQDNCPGFNISMSEWCELPCENEARSVEAATRMARIMTQDMADIGANSWSSWVAINQHGIGVPEKDTSDGMISAADDFSEYYLTSRYYAMQHFSAHIPAGSVRVGATSRKFPLITTAAGWETFYSTPVNYSAYTTPDGDLVVVVVNEGEERDISIASGRKHMTVYQTDSRRRHALVYDGTAGVLTMPENSIVTVVLK